MRHADPPAGHASRPSETAATPALSARELAHELNSLLDGSMRCLRRTRRDLESGDAATGPAGSDLADAVARLRLAEDAMSGMARLIAQALRVDAGFPGAANPNGPLREEAERILAAVAPLAEEHEVDLVTHISAAAAELPAGPLGTVLLNGLRNAVQAASSAEPGTAPGAGPRQVELSIDLNARTARRRELVMLITDTGPGVPYRKTSRVSSRLSEESPDACHLTPEATPGHGIGLDLSRRILDSLGGSLQLTNVPFGAGAVLRIVVPLSSLIQQ